MEGRRLERSKVFAEPSFAELAGHERSFHADASLFVLEYKPVAMRSNHDAKTAADVVNVIPAS
jgi:hypothetical protein